MKKQKGITLVALIITIIILLILATVSISLVINNKILDKAQYGVDKYSEEEELEKIKLAVASAMLKGNGFLDTDNLNRELHDMVDENENAEKIKSTWYYKNAMIEEDGTVEKYDKILPKEFQQLEFIESTGTQYIDTKCRINYDYEIAIDYQSKEPYGYWNCIIGSNNDINNKFRFCFLNYNNVCFHSGYTDSIAFNINLEGTRNKIVLENGMDVTTIKINEQIKQISTRVLPDGIQDTNWTILASKLGSSIRDGRKGKIFSATMYYKNEKVRDFIPSYSTTIVVDADGIEQSKGTIGMYDTVEGKFYVNKGNGAFLRGPEVQE